MARGTGDGQFWPNISATPANFSLLGGRYQLAAVATFGGGSVTLNQIGPDGSTLIPCSTGTTLIANGGGIVDLPPGQYQLTIATATAVYATLVRIPGD